MNAPALSVGSLIISFTLGGIAPARDALVYSSDFSADPGWTTNVPDQMYWDAGSGRYHIENRAGGGQSSYFNVAIAAGANIQFEFDLTMVRINHASAISLGLNSGDAPFGSTHGIWTNWGRGGGGNGATAGYQSSAGFGSFPAPYSFLATVGTTYHVAITLDAIAQSMRWQVLTGGVTVAYHSTTGVGMFSAFDRIICQNVNSGGGTAEGYIDNLNVWTLDAVPPPPFPGPIGPPAVPLPSAATMAGAGMLAVFGARCCRRRA